MVITEYVPYGDLLGFLRKSRGLQDNYYKDPDIKPQSSLRPKQLFGFAWDIASGMEFLASEKVCMLWDVNDHGVELLAAKKKGESFAASMSWIRAKVSFALLRSSLFFLRVSRVSRRVNFRTVGHWLRCWKRTRKYSIRTCIENANLFLLLVRIRLPLKIYFCKIKMNCF